jgi:FKBP-type peptidyl-prolyl cis-trans isomerase FkpA
MKLILAVLLAAAGCASTGKGPKASKTETLDSGLIFTELKAGNGRAPTVYDSVRVHYEGTLADGTVFDSSIKRGQPLVFPLNGVIRCWQEGLLLMSVGSKARLVCPPNIAYGSRGAGPIPPNSTLTFEVELLGIEGLNGRARP